MMPTVAVVVLSLWLGPATPQAPQTPYAAVVELYQHGDEELALEKLTPLADDEIRLGRDALLYAWRTGRGRELERAEKIIRAAVLLHTVRAFGARAHEDVYQFQYQFKFARDYVDLLASREGRVTPFIRTWQLFVISSFQGQSAVQDARQFSRGARDPRGDSALFLLALGATEEMGWSFHQEGDAPAPVNGDLKDAERYYRQALVVASDLVEARVRLGRVLALRHDDESMTVFKQIGESIEAPYRYLARLFEGDVYERAGRLAEAERQYLAAVMLMPQSQSAFIALAHVRHAQGARTQAAQDVRVTTGERGVADTADPWFWYARGTAWRGPVYLDDLRKMIEP